MAAVEENGRFEEVSFDGIVLILDQNENEGKGRLIVGETAIRWVPESREEEAEAVEFAFKEISMSAVANVPEISSDAGSCLYLQIDQERDDDGAQSDEEGGSRDVYLVGPSEEVLEAMFKAMCDGALRNPDSDADEQGQGNMFFDMDSIIAGSFDPSITGANYDPEGLEDASNGDTDEEK